MAATKKKAAKKAPVKRKPAPKKKVAAKKPVKKSSHKTTKKVMAKKRKSSPRKSSAPRRRTSSRRRISGVGAVDYTNVLMLIAGAVGAQLIVTNVLPDMDAKIKSAVIAAAGLLVLPSVMKGATGTALGTGLAVGGGISLIREFGILEKIGMVDYYPFPQRMIAGANGIQDMVAGNGIQQQVAGVPQSNARSYGMVG